MWVGCDVSRDMLQVAKERMEETLEPQGKDGKMKESDSDKDSDDDEEDEEPTPSTGDLLHHVRIRVEGIAGFGWHWPCSFVF